MLSEHELPGEGHHADVVPGDLKNLALAGQPYPVEQIRYLHRQRCFAMEQRKRSDLALGAFLRTAMGWSRERPKSEQEAIRAKASLLQKIGDKVAKQEDKPQDKRKPVKGADHPEFVEWRNLILATVKGRAPFDAIESHAVKEMAALAKTLPAWSTLGAAIRGFGPASLAVIVAEAGDLAAYSSHSKLWKRMGVAVMGDVRQGGLPKTASKEQWIEHGYNRQRRSRMWNIGDALIKGNKGGIYRTIYLARKAYEIGRDPEMKPIKAHRRAQRYMEKRLLRDLWRAWRDERKAKQPSPEPADGSVPTAHPVGQEAKQALPMSAPRRVPIAQTNERKAKESMPERAGMAVPTAHPNEREAVSRAPARASNAVPISRPKKRAVA